MIKQVVFFILIIFCYSAIGDSKESSDSTDSCAAKPYQDKCRSYPNPGLPCAGREDCLILQPPEYNDGGGSTGGGTGYVIPSNRKLHFEIQRLKYTIRSLQKEIQELSKSSHSHGPKIGHPYREAPRGEMSLSGGGGNSDGHPYREAPRGEMSLSGGSSANNSYCDSDEYKAERAAATASGSPISPCRMRATGGGIGGNSESDSQPGSSGIH